MSHITIESAIQRRPCAYCGQPLQIGEPAWQCDECLTVHHIDCWVDGDGCASFGCANSGAVRGESSGPKSGAPKGVKPAASTPSIPPVRPDRAESQRSKQWLTAAVAIFALAMIAIIATAVVRSNSDNSTVSKTAATTVEPEVGGVSEDVDEEIEVGNELPTETASQSTSAIVRALREYERAFQQGDAELLDSLFTPNVVRRGHNPDRGGCVYDRGRDAVTDAYSAQFRENPDLSSFVLIPLNRDMISLENDRRARTYDGLEFRFKGYGTNIAFKFRRVDSGDWKISLVRVAC